MRGTRAREPSIADATPRRRRARRLPDEGLVPVLEALIIGVIVGSAILFAVSFQAPPAPSATPGAQQMDTITWDMVQALDHMFYNDTSYSNSTLSKAVAEAMAGDSTNLTSLLETFLPPGAQYNVYLNNGVDRMPVHETREPSGQTVGISYPFEPRWRYTYVEPDLEVYNREDTMNTMGVTTIPLFNSNLVRDQGATLEVLVRGDQAWVPGQQTLPGSPDYAFTESAVTSFLQGGHKAADPTSNHPSVSIYMLCKTDLGAQRPCYAVDYTEAPKSDYAPYSPLNMTLALENNGAGTLDPGAKLTVRFPVGLRVNGTLDDSSWTNVRLTGQAPNPQTLHATLDTTLGTGGSTVTLGIDLNLTENAADNRYAYKQVTANLEQGAVSESEFLLKLEAKTEATYTGGDSRVVLISGPKPSGAGADATGRWGVVMPTPFSTTEIDEVNLTLTDWQQLITGARMPADFTPNGGPQSAGSVSFNTTQVSWTPSSTYSESGYGFVEFQFEIDTTGQTTTGSAKFPPAAPRPLYPGFAPQPSTIQLHPGIWWSENPPENDNAPPLQDLPGFPTQNDTLEGRLAFRNTVISGSTNYSSDYFPLTSQLLGGQTEQFDQNLAKIKDSLQAAKLSVDNDRVPVGQWANIDLDASDLASFLSQKVGINNMNMTTHIYAPWGVRDRIPVATYNHSATAGTSLIPYDIEIDYLDGDGAHDLVVSSSDGTLYGVAGPTSRNLPGQSWSLPESGTPANPASAPIITKARGGGVTKYALGTSQGTDNIYQARLSPSAAKNWSSAKAEDNSNTHGINASADLTGDGFPEVFVSNSAQNSGWTNPAGISRLRLYNGYTGKIIQGWEADPTGSPVNYGVQVNGSAHQLGMGKVGPDARDGVWTNTGMVASVSLTPYQLTTRVEDIQEPGTPQGKIEAIQSLTLPSIQTGTYDSGLAGFYEEGRQAWNHSGGRFVRLATADQVPTGGDWTGFVGGGGDGWLYGLSAKKSITPVTGWEYGGGWVAIQDIAMANAYEGYMATGDGFLIGTSDSWTTTNNYVEKTIDGGGKTVYTARLYPGVRAVDTVDDQLTETGGKTSWWAGESGLVLVSNDGLESLANQTGALATLYSTIGVTGGDTDLGLPDLTTLDSTNIRFNDVYAAGANEAWLVGEGVAGALDGKGYIAYTDDGAASFRITEIECTALSSCALNAIDHDGQRLWVVGEHGTVLVQAVDGMSSNVTLQNAPAGTSDGKILVNLDVNGWANVTSIRADWSTPGDIDWMDKLTLNTTGGNTRTLWDHGAGNLTAASASVTPISSYDATKGVADNATLNVKTYDNTGTDDDNNQWNQKLQLQLGPFKKNELLGTSTYTDLDFPTPTNVTLHIAYEDGSQDILVVGIGNDAKEDHEASLGQWETPAEAGYTVPATCFGDTDGDCGTFHDVNVTALPGTGLLSGYVVGEKQSSPDQAAIYRLADHPMTPTWEAIDSPVDSTLHGVARNVADPTRVVAVGENDRVLMSYDMGKNWTDMPKIYDLGMGAAMPLRAVDFTHPEVPYLVGGSAATGVLWTVDGYTEWGRVVTEDLYADGGGDPELTYIGFNTTDLPISQDGTSSQVRVELKNGTDWTTIFEPATGWKLPAEGSAREELDDGNNETFVVPVAPTKEVELRITLHTPSHGFSRFSPQVRGQLEVRGFAGPLDQESWDSPDWAATMMDVNDTGAFTSGSDSVELTGAPNAMLRLKPVHNPWVAKLGNPNSDYGTVGGDTAGARVADMDLSLDGSTVYVGTEGVYQIGAAFTEAPLGDDNTVYAYDVSSGLPVEDWVLTQVGGGDRITHVEAYDGGVYVIAEDEASGQPTLYKLDDTGTELGSFTWSGSATVHDLEVAKIWGSTLEDPVIAIQDSVTGGGVYALQGSTMGQQYVSNPAFKGAFQFAYQVPTNATYGAYIIESKFKWQIANNFDQEITQTARIHNAFTVTGENRKVALSPTYTLDVIVWMEDWG